MVEVQELHALGHGKEGLSFPFLVGKDGDDVIASFGKGARHLSKDVLDAAAVANEFMKICQHDFHGFFSLYDTFLARMPAKISRATCQHP